MHLNNGSWLSSSLTALAQVFIQAEQGRSGGLGGLFARRGGQGGADFDPPDVDLYGWLGSRLRCEGGA
jgi:hypothetical protein